MSGALFSAESAENRRRGRPPVIPELHEALYRSQYGDMPRRKMLERHYEIRALRTLGNGNQAEFRWLFGDGTETNYRQSVLAALGRIEDRDILLTVARQICEMKPKARNAVAMIRRVRRGDSPVKCGGLAHELIRTVNDYLVRHPSMSWDGVRAELEQALDMVEESARLEAAS